MRCPDEENRIHELSSEVSRLQTAVQKQREEMRSLEHGVCQKNAELEVVGFNFFVCLSLLIPIFKRVLLW